MASADLSTLARALHRRGLDAGLSAVGIASADPFTDARAILEARKAAGLHGGMHFTYGDPSRSTDPGRTLPGAATLVVGARSYLRAEPEPPIAPGPHGRVARYSWRDHYVELRAALAAIADLLEGAGWRARVVADDNALVDREAAYRAGVGWYGKNANLLLPARDRGSCSGRCSPTHPFRTTARRWPTDAVRVPGASPPAPPAPSWRPG